MLCLHLCFFFFVMKCNETLQDNGKNKLEKEERTKNNNHAAIKTSQPIV